MESWTDLDRLQEHVDLTDEPVICITMHSHVGSYLAGILDTITSQWASIPNELIQLQSVLHLAEPVEQTSP